MNALTKYLTAGNGFWLSDFDGHAEIVEVTPQYGVRYFVYDGITKSRVREVHVHEFIDRVSQGGAGL